MKLFTKLALSACGLVASGLFAAAVAMPMTPAAPVGQSADSLVLPIHGCHQNVERGRAGWHHHSRRSCRRIADAPPRRSRDFRSAPPRRGPVCTKQCKYIGPIKTCKTVCR